MADYTDAELIELYEERCAVREYDGITAREHDMLSEAQRSAHRRAAEQAAYYDLKRLVGNVPMPQTITDMARKFRPE